MIRYYKAPSSILAETALHSVTTPNEFSPVDFNLSCADIHKSGSSLQSDFEQTGLKTPELKTVTSPILPNTEISGSTGFNYNSFNDDGLNYDDIQQTLKHSYAKKQARKGAVYLVGAGSGDPELLTLKAYRVMQQADVVLYDSLVSEDILDMCARSATKIFVGKRRDNHALPQQDINELLVTHAQAGKCVVRLKGGDPFIFGRGGEELQTVVQHGIFFESIPGITAASAAASSASIPLTHRNCAQSVKFVTAYKKTNSPNEDFAEMLDPTQTVVLYMGLHRLESLTEGLIKAGRSPDTPFALISHASLPTQQTLVGTLESISTQQALAQLPTPALLIMGDVVHLHHELAAYNLNNKQSDPIYDDSNKTHSKNIKENSKGTFSDSLSLSCSWI